jgi:hypothetical protein
MRPDRRSAIEKMAGEFCLKSQSGRKCTACADLLPQARREADRGTLLYRAAVRPKGGGGVVLPVVPGSGFAGSVFGGSKLVFGGSIFGGCAPVSG